MYPYQLHPSPTAWERGWGVRAKTARLFPTQRTQVPYPYQTFRRQFSLVRALIPIARAEFTIAPPPAGSPRFARGTAKGAPTRFPLRAGGTSWLKGVGFLRACLLAALPSRAFLPSCERDARAPSTRDAGNAGVPPAMPTAREKNLPLQGTSWRGSSTAVFVNSGSAIGMTTRSPDD